MNIPKVKSYLEALTLGVSFLVTVYFILRASAHIGFEPILSLASGAFLILMGFRSRLYWFIAFPLLIVASLYLPTAAMYGFPNEDIVVALFYTRPEEIKGYLSVIAGKEYLYAGILLASSLVFGMFYTKIKQSSRTKLAIGASALLFLLALLPVFRTLFWQESYPFAFFKRIGEIINTISHADMDKNGLSKWTVSGVDPLAKYDDYVLVIGESARKDYLSAFGYPQDTSPFMRQSKGTLVDGLVSSGATTISSLTQILTLPTTDNTQKDRINYQYNLIDLAKQNGFVTYWISAQGKYGYTESPIAIIGQKSDFVYFSKIKGDNLKGPSDFTLLPVFQNQLMQPINPKKKRLFVIHLFGSHFDSCDRIDKINPTFKHSRGRPYLCYMSSIEQTDKMLAQIANILNKSSRSYSMLYFSDHGQGQDQDAIRHNAEVKQGYDVPLFRLNSDDTHQKIIVANKTGFKLIHGLANWMSLSATEIDSQYDLFSEQNDENIVVKGNPLKRYDELKDDFAIE